MIFNVVDGVGVTVGGGGVTVGDGGRIVGDGGRIVGDSDCDGLGDGDCDGVGVEPVTMRATPTCAFPPLEVIAIVPA